MHLRKKNKGKTTFLSLLKQHLPGELQYGIFNVMNIEIFTVVDEALSYLGCYATVTSK
jgi:hypothetical protein